MGDPFIAEVRIWANTFAPRGWAQCMGQIIPIGENQAMYSLIGNRYGGDGRNNFGLPVLQGRTPLHWGSGPAQPPYDLAQKGGVPSVILTADQMPSHTHHLQGDDRVPEGGEPKSDTLIANFVGHQAYLEDKGTPPSGLIPMSDLAIGIAGASQAHENRQPFLALNFCIALIGFYPPRN